MKDLRTTSAHRVGAARRAASPPARFATLVWAVAVDIAVITVTVLLGVSASSVLLVAAGTVLAVALTTQRALRSALAGLILLLVRPYAPGERVRLYLPERCRVVDAEVVALGLVTTTLATRDGLLVVPNALLLRHPPQCR